MNTIQTRRLTRYQIQTEMKRRRLLQEDVAARAGVTQPIVSRAITRHTKVDPVKVARVFAALDALFAEYAPLDTRGPRDKAGKKGTA